MSDGQIRRAWREYAGATGRLTTIPFGPARVNVARPTVAAWQALEAVLVWHGYAMRKGEIFGYNYRPMRGGTALSYHAYGLALDVNSLTNPLRETPNRRAVSYSNAAEQDDRARDVKAGRADTDMTRDLIADVRAIRTANGKRVFVWGGDWNTRKDAMHFQIACTPADLASGIDLGQVRPDLETYTPDPAGSEDFHPGSWAADFGTARGFDALAPLVTARLVEDFNLPDFQAAAIVGNLGGESNLAAVQEVGQPFGKGGFGWAQWTGARRRVFERWCRENNHAPTSNEGNYGFLKAELSGTVRDSNESAALRALQVATTIEEATKTFELKYERAGVKRYEARIGKARDALRLFRIHIQTRGTAPSNDVEDFSMTRNGVKGLQKALTNLNYHLGEADGVVGPLTQSAILSFQRDHYLPLTGRFDTMTVAALDTAYPRGMPQERADITAAELRQLGSETIKNADRTQYAGWAMGGIGGAGLLNSYIGGGSSVSSESLARAINTNRDELIRIFGRSPELDSAIANARSIAGRGLEAAGGGSTLETLSTWLPYLASGLLPGAGGSLAAIALGFASHYFGRNIIDRRVEDQRLGMNIRSHR